MNQSNCITKSALVIANLGLVIRLPLLIPSYYYYLFTFQGEERRAALVARAETSSLHEDEYNWDSDEGEGNRIKESIGSKSLDLLTRRGVDFYRVSQKKDIDSVDPID